MKKLVVPIFVVGVLGPASLALAVTGNNPPARGLKVPPSTEQRAEVDAIQTTTSTTYQDLSSYSALGGPQVTTDMSAGTSVTIFFYNQARAGTNNVIGREWFAVKDLTTGQTLYAGDYNSGAAWGGYQGAIGPLTLSPGLHTFKMFYSADPSSVSASFRYSTLDVVVTPNAPVPDLSHPAT